MPAPPSNAPQQPAVINFVESLREQSKRAFIENRAMYIIAEDVLERAVEADLTLRSASSSSGVSAMGEGEAGVELKQFAVSEYYSLLEGRYWRYGLLDFHHSLCGRLFYDPGRLSLFQTLPLLKVSSSLLCVRIVFIFIVRSLQ